MKDDLIFEGKEVEVVSISKYGNDDIITFCNKTLGYGALRKGRCFAKPTQEEKLARLIYEFGGTDTHYCESLSKAILAGEIEGLEYKKPQ